MEETGTRSMIAGEKQQGDGLHLAAGAPQSVWTGRVPGCARERSPDGGRAGLSSSNPVQWPQLSSVVWTRRLGPAAGVKQDTQPWVKATCCSERWGRHGQHTGDTETLQSKRS